jgi:hypothetical protein
MIEEIVCLVGNKDFDTQDGEFMFMREQVAAKSDRKLGRAVHFYDTPFQAAQESLHPVELTVPLQFWFNNFIEQSLPVIGLYWHEIQLNLSLRSLADLTYTIGTQPGSISTTGLTSGGLNYLCNFQYLDRPERALFANDKLEQVFIQHQTLGEEHFGATDNFKDINIRFNHPVTDLMWAPRLVSRTSGLNKEWFNFNGTPYTIKNLGSPAGPTFAAETFREAQIFFNNTDRTVELSAEYLRQIPQHRSQRRISPDDMYRVYGYCFGIDVNDVLHTGSANFSRYDNATLRLGLWGSGTSTWAVADGASVGTYLTTNISLGCEATVRVHARNFQARPSPFLSITCLILTITSLFSTAQ